MPHFDTRLRPPAYRLSLSGRIASALNALATFVFGCRHRTITLPHHNTQRCLGCGAHRLYLFTDTGIFKGKWAKANSPSDPDRQRTQREIVKGLEPGRAVTQ